LAICGSRAFCSQARQASVCWAIPRTKIDDGVESRRSRTVASEHGADDPGESVDPLAAVLRGDGRIDGADRAEGQHGRAPRAWTKRAI